MCIRKRIPSLLYKIAFVVLGLVGLFLNTGSPGDLDYFITAIQYYSIVCLIGAIALSLAEGIATALYITRVGPYGTTPFIRRVKGAFVMLMVFEVVVYFVFLAGTSFTNSPDAGWLAGALVHYVLPLMYIADYVLFDPKGVFCGIDPVYWLILPLVYFAGIVVAAQLGNLFFGGASYPYTFINPDQSDWVRILLNVLYLSVTFLILSYVLFVVDRILAALDKKRIEKSRIVAASAYDMPGRIPKAALEKRQAEQARSSSAPPETPVEAILAAEDAEEEAHAADAAQDVDEMAEADEANDESEPAVPEAGAVAT